MKIQYDKIHRLIYNLLYPAVLGAMIMYIGSAIIRGNLHWYDFSFWFAVFIAFYFSIQHVQNGENDDEHYSWKHFIKDTLEIFCVFAIFHFLGISDTIVKPNWPVTFGILAFSFILPVLARFKIRRKWENFLQPEKILTRLSGGICLVAIIAAIVDCTRIIITIVMALVFLFYLIFYVLRKKE